LALKNVVPFAFLKYGTLSAKSTMLAGLISSNIKKRLSMKNHKYYKH
jgi:hypothetical protein